MAREIGVTFGACSTGRLLSHIGGGWCRGRRRYVEEGHEFRSLCEEFLLLPVQFLKELVLCCGEGSSMFLCGVECGFKTVGVFQHVVLI